MFNHDTTEKIADKSVVFRVPKEGITNGWGNDYGIGRGTSLCSFCNDLSEEKK